MVSCFTGRAEHVLLDAQFAGQYGREWRACKWGKSLRSGFSVLLVVMMLITMVIMVMLLMEEEDRKGDDDDGPCV
jgi:hypothetical protein